MNTKKLKSLNPRPYLLLLWACVLIMISSTLKADYYQEDYNADCKLVQLVIQHQLPEVPCIGDLILIPVRVSDNYTIYLECYYTQDEYDLVLATGTWYEIY